MTATYAYKKYAIGFLRVHLHIRSMHLSVRKNNYNLSPQMKKID